MSDELFHWTHSFVYMRCSDVSEFEHIYGQISTTPSCVYDPLFTRTRMMVVICADRVKEVDTHLFFDISQVFWHCTAAYTKFRRIIGSMI